MGKKISPEPRCWRLAWARETLSQKGILFLKKSLSILQTQSQEAVYKKLLPPLNMCQTGNGHRGKDNGLHYPHIHGGHSRTSKNCKLPWTPEYTQHAWVHSSYLMVERREERDNHKRRLASKSRGTTELQSRVTTSSAPDARFTKEC